MSDTNQRASYPRQPGNAVYPSPVTPPGYPTPARFHTQEPPAEGWNPCSILAAVCAAVGFLAPLAVVLGLVAVVQCSRSFQRGRGLAISAILIGGLVTIALFYGATAMPHN